MRGFEVCKGFNNVNLPKRSTKYSAGYDFESLDEVIIKPKEVKLIKTGIKAFMEKDEVLFIFPRSSLATKKHLNLANNIGVIDADYYSNEKNDGHIMIPIYNFGTEEVIINKNERIAQGIFQKYLVTSDDTSVEHRAGGFGSTNKE